MGKLKCRLFGHQYPLVGWDFTFHREHMGTWVYHIENRCARCGKERQLYVGIPAPPQLKREEAD